MKKEIKVKYIELKENKDDDCNCGSLVAIESNIDIPFEIKRVFYIYKVSKDQQRGEHAHKKTNQLLIALSGSCEITLDDGKNKESFILNSPKKALLQKNLVWGGMKNFSKDCVLMVLCDSFYDKEDYIYDYSEFLKWVK